MYCLFSVTLIIIIIILAGVSATENVTVCDTETRRCVCDFNGEGGIHFFTVDCSFVGSEILNTTNNLPVPIQTLDLSKNNLTRVDKSNLLQSNNMLMLKLNNNKINHITVDALSLPELQHLDLSENDLQFLDPEVFRNSKSLVHLNLASNKFTSLPPMAFHHLYKLETINLDFNDLGGQLRNTSLFQRNGLALTTKIRIISMSGVNLNRMPSNFFTDAYQLTYLRVSRNNLEDFPELPFTLEYLDISDNLITDLYFEDFSNLPSMRELKLDNLLIKEIPDFIFTPMKALLKLSLERNGKLTWFSPLAFGRQVLDDPDYFMLEDLSLRGSRLSNISQDLLLPFGQLIKLDLQGNLWNCDCNLLWIKQLQIPERDRDHIRCYTPIGLYNSRVFDVQDQYFNCLKGTHRVFIALAIAACMALAAIAITLFSITGRTSRASTMQAASSRPNVFYSEITKNHRRL